MEVSVDHKDMVDYEVDTIQAVESFSSFLSIIACLFMSRYVVFTVILCYTTSLRNSLGKLLMIEQSIMPIHRRFEMTLNAVKAE